MSVKLLKVRPTKIELIRLRRRHRLASRIQKIIKDRLSILTMEFLQMTRETVEARRKMNDDFARMYKALTVSAGYHGYVALGKELIAGEGDIEIAVGSRNVGGVKLPAFEMEIPERKMRDYDLLDTSAWLDQTSQLAQKCLEDMVALAELQNNLELLGREINRAKRIVNALEYLIIPSLRETTKYLNMKFEERDREEKSRLKRVKVLLEKR